MWPYIAALLPSAGLLYLFFVIMKHILEADRRERIAQSQWDRDHDDDTEQHIPTQERNSSHP